MAVQLQQPIEQEQQFQPQLTEQQTRSYVNAYRNDRTRYEPQLESIRAHAQYYNVPFYEGDFSIIEAVKQAGAGFVEGFTTLKIADHPDNEYEAIFGSQFKSGSGYYRFLTDHTAENYLKNGSSLRVV